MFCNPLQLAAVDLPHREMLLFLIHYRFEIVKHSGHLVEDLCKTCHTISYSASLAALR
ncbi:Uncharacterised protein [Shigella sonnei]|nr:Uncharacterised protein [Shigella sonnei]CSS38449.1 Uncharacterised protein [Shigella sonnei]